MAHSFRSLDTYREHLTTILFLGGFLFDMILLPDIDDPKAKFFGLAYLASIALLIIFREWLVTLNRATKFEERLYRFSTFGIVCLLGSSLSFVFIYALRSAAFSVSWPLFLILFICILANEFVSTHNLRLALDVGILFVAVLFYTIFHLPVILKMQNDMTFMTSIILAIIVCLIYSNLLSRSSETAKHESARTYALAIGIPMFVGMLYFLNILPAVPLSLASSGVYHTIVRESNGQFTAEAESVDSDSYFSKLLAKVRPETYHLLPTDNGIYFFSAVRAPAELTAPLSHVWEYYNEEQKKWIPTTTISFTLAGGREDGYRSYSKKENVIEGLWRVTVKVDSNRVVGQKQFFVKKAASAELKDVKI